MKKLVRYIRRMVVQLFLITIGVVILSFAGKIVARAVVDIARHFRVSPFLIALFLVAFATSIPELFVGINAAVEGDPSLSLGDVFGSNIVNLTLIAGVTIVLGRKGISLGRNMSSSQLLWTFGAGTLPFLLILDGEISRIDGALLLLMFAAFFTFLTRKRTEVIETANTEGEGEWAYIAESAEKPRKKIIPSLALFALGMILLLGGARLVVEMSEGLALRIGIPIFLIGLFIVAIGTSLPELVYGIRSALSKESELGLGNVIGSSAVNSSLILGVVALIHPIVPAAFDAAVASGLFMFVVFAIVIFLSRGARTLYMREGLLLIVLYLLFVAYQARTGGFF